MRSNRLASHLQRFWFLALLLLAAASYTAEPAFAEDATIADDAATHQPLALHPENPHYFLFRGKPTVIITSGEHYGAVLNRDFDYKKYLDTLAADGLNNTRLFSGAYCEPAGAFNITKNTLAPADGKLICPWPRSDQPGYKGGGNKFDLTRFDDEYFARLRDFMTHARQRGVIVEMNLFCPFYEDVMWDLSPMKASNNTSGVGDLARTDVYTLDKNGSLLAIQAAMVEKIVRELNGFDNLYYEICNEPYFGGVTLDWQHRIADIIIATEKDLPHKHLIAQNVANGSHKVTDPHPGISIFNFHYASPPTTVAENYALNKPIGDNETGFRGTADEHYRMEAWEFILAGGSLYNNLDYSFTVGHEEGTFDYPKTQPGGGNPGFRRQLHTLVEFINRFDFISLKPDTSTIQGGLPDKARAHVLSQPGQQYAIYVFGSGTANLKLALPPGTYELATLDPKTGKRTPLDQLRAAEPSTTLPTLTVETDLAVELRKAD